MSTIELITAWVLAHWLWIAILSVIVVIASFIGFSVFIISLPPDYFTQKKQVSRIKNSIVRVCLQLLKNVIGVIALIAGLVMLLAPGQGVLTILVGVILCDFPGKRTLEHKLIARPFVLSAINRIRLRYKRPPIVLEDGRGGWRAS